MTDIEAILQAKIAEDNEQAALAGNIAMVPGALLGAGAGFDVGSIQHAVGQGKDALMNRVTKMVGGKVREPGIMERLRPGTRMAGGLIGAVLGGALGKVAMEEALKSDAGKLLAKAQINGELNEQDKSDLQQLVAAYYNQQGLM